MKVASRNRTQYWQLVVFLMLCSITLIIGDHRMWWDGIRNFIEIRIINTRVDHTENNTEKITNLESKILSLEHKNSEIIEENIFLRKQLESPLPPVMTFVPGYVISIEVSKENALLKIAAGERDGVKKGMPVISESILIGTVIATTPRIATVQLLSSNASKIAVTTSSGAHGLIRGTVEQEGPYTVLLDRVLQTEIINIGDTVITSGEDELPRNLLIGKVSTLKSEVREPFQKASVSLFVNPNSLKRVFIVSNY